MIILFIALAILLVLVVCFIIFYPIILKRKYKKGFVKIYGKKIYRYALHNDLYLINQLELRCNDDQMLNIDHLLFGNKYIYVISDYYLPGVIEAKENDQSFIYQSIEKNSQKVYIDSLLLRNEAITKKLAVNLGLNPSLFVSIAIVDNDSEFKELKKTNKDNYMIHISNFSKLLNKLESRNVAPLNDEQLKYTVKDVNRLNERRKERTKH